MKRWNLFMDITTLASGVFFPLHKILKFKSVEKPLKYDDDNSRLFSSQYHQIIRKATISLSFLSFFCVLPVGLLCCYACPSGKCHHVCFFVRSQNDWRDLFHSLYPQNTLPMTSLSCSLSRSTSCRSGIHWGFPCCKLWKSCRQPLRKL